MIEVQLAGHATARVWFGSVVALPLTRSLVRRVRGGGDSAVEPVHVAIEAIVPRGGYSQYGLLGFAFVPGDGGGVEIEVRYSEVPGDRWPHALAGPLDEVHVGLLREFANPILETAAGFAERSLPQGTLRVVDAAHGEIGSSAGFFERIALACLSLISDERLRSAEAMPDYLSGILVNA